MLWEFLKEQKSHMTGIFLGVMAGLLIAFLLFDNPNLQTGLIAAIIGFIIGEIIVFFVWRKKRKNL